MSFRFSQCVSMVREIDGVSARPAENVPEAGRSCPSRVRLLLGWWQVWTGDKDAVLAWLSAIMAAPSELRAEVRDDGRQQLHLQWQGPRPDRAVGRLSPHRLPGSGRRVD